MNSGMKQLVALSILTLSLPVSAQTGKPTQIRQTAPIASQAQTQSSVDPAMQLRALETMNHVVGSNLSKAKTRESQMMEFLDSKGMTEGFNEYADPPKMMHQAMSFQEALQVAVKHEAVMGPAETDLDPAALQREITAFTNLDRTLWTQYQQEMVKNQRLTDYLKSNDLFNEYHSWADNKNADARKQMLDSAHERAQKDAEFQQKREVEVNKAIDEAHARYEKHHQEMLNTAWHHYQWRQELNQEYYKDQQEYSHGGYDNGYGDPYNDVDDNY